MIETLQRSNKLMISAYPINDQFLLNDYQIKITKKNFTCQPIHSECPDLPKQIQKFYKKRFFLFKRFQEGILLDEESWYSVIPEDMSVHIATKLQLYSPTSEVIDGFCGSGGLAIQLAQKFKTLTCVDIDPIKIKNINNNLSVYGVKADVKQMSFLDYVPTGNDNILVMCPPWGGLNYQKSTYNLNTMKPSLFDLLDKALQISKKIVLQLPKNIDLNQLGEIFSNVNTKLRLQPKTIEIEQLLINEQLNQLIIYYGFSL